MERARFRRVLLVAAYRGLVRCALGVASPHGLHLKGSLRMRYALALGILMLVLNVMGLCPTGRRCRAGICWKYCPDDSLRHRRRRNGRAGDCDGAGARRERRAGGRTREERSGVDEASRPRKAGPLRTRVRRSDTRFEFSSRRPCWLPNGHQIRPAAIHHR